MSDNIAPVLVGVDGSEGSKQALRWAADYAQLAGAPLQALIVWDNPSLPGKPGASDDVEFENQAETTLDETIASVLGDSVPVTRLVQRGYPAEIIVTTWLSLCAALGLTVERGADAPAVRSALFWDLAQYGWPCQSPVAVPNVQSNGRARRPQRRWASGEDGVPWRGAIAAARRR